ncbi:response regulator [Massilia brevitalea]|uniref:response regulator n=1 Tax=Massilia brevitalea TaxID=442526 RepID=UPI002738A699|nr:response regulator [Massilia brevitalea]
MDPTLILLVDDDLVDRMACRRRLAGGTPEFFAVIEAEDGETGLQLARSTQPQCILLDHHLPDLSGLDFLARLRAEPDDTLRHLPVLMLTGADSAAIATEAMRRGAGDYLVKDGEGRYLDLLSATVERLVRERRMMEEKRRAEAKFRTLVEQIQAISYVVAPERPDALDYISPQIRALGYTAEEWLADPGLHAACMLPEERAGVVQLLHDTRRHGLPLRHEYRLRARDGTLLWFRDQADLVRDEGGRPLFVQGTLVDITVNKLAEQSLNQSQDALRRLAAYQERIRENERQRIARELHDELGGVLTGIKAYLSVLGERSRQSREAPDPLLGEAGELAQNAIDTMRRVITDLRPSVLDQLGIWAALEWQLDQVGKRAGLQCSCAIDPVAAIALDPDRSTVLFRIVQEALTNVQRHAQASRVALQVRRDGAELVLTVEDDGRGVHASSDANGSWGILGMQERSRSVGGDLAILPRPGGGTMVRLRLPVEVCHA